MEVRLDIARPHPVPLPQERVVRPSFIVNLTPQFQNSVEGQNAFYKAAGKPALRQRERCSGVYISHQISRPAGWLVALSRVKSRYVALSRDIPRGEGKILNHERSTLEKRFVRTERADRPHWPAFARISPHLWGGEKKSELRAACQTRYFGRNHRLSPTMWRRGRKMRRFACSESPPCQNIPMPQAKCQSQLTLGCYKNIFGGWTG